MLENQCCEFAFALKLMLRDLFEIVLQHNLPDVDIAALIQSRRARIGRPLGFLPWNVASVCTLVGRRPMMTTLKDTRFLAGVIAVASVLLAAWVTVASYQPVTVADTDIVTQVTAR